MEPLLISTGAVAVSEIGDKTQLLALLLASRFRRPIPIILGILVATLANHALAGLLGQWLGSAIAPELLRWGLGVLFLGMAAWVLMPDKMEGDNIGRLAAGGAFLVTTVTFFLAEIGDKTQIATVALAAQFNSLLFVVIGTTAGMLIADVPAVVCGQLAGGRLNPHWVRLAAAAIFATLGLLVLLGVEIV
jgi:Ca2+/H+ antiporter, TMEM165/GDT1 family